MKQERFKLVSNCIIKISTITSNASAGEIGRSMLLGETENSAQDVEAVYEIVTSLLYPSTSVELVSMSGLAADHFTKMPNNIYPEDLLKVRKARNGHDEVGLTRR